MSMSRTFSIILRLFYLVRGSFSRFVPMFTWVAIDMVLWGFISKYLNTVTSSGPNFIVTFLGAVLLWNFFIRVMQGVTMGFFEDVWSRNFLNVFASPLLISEYVSGLVVWSTLTSLIWLVVMLFLATAFFGLSYFVFGLMLIPFLLILFLFGIALGIFASAIVLRLGPASEWFIWPIPALISPFAGVFYPITTLPQWMRYISRLFPPSYVFESMRKIIAGETASTMVLCWSGGLAVFYLVLACWFFTFIFRYAVRTGLIARYSAESVM